MNSTSSNSGYIGLISLLIGVLIICFLMLKTYSATHKATPSALEPNAQGLTPVEQAEAAKKMLEKNNGMYSQ